MSITESKKKNNKELGRTETKSCEDPSQNRSGGPSSLVILLIDAHQDSYFSLSFVCQDCLLLSLLYPVYECSPNAKNEVVHPSFTLLFFFYFFILLQCFFSSVQRSPKCISLQHRHRFTLCCNFISTTFEHVRALVVKSVHKISDRTINKEWKYL